MYYKRVGSNASRTKSEPRVEKVLMARATAPAADEVDNLNDTADDTADDNDTEEDEPESKDNDRSNLESLAPGSRVSVMVTMPKELKILLLDEAEKAGDSYTLARFVRELLADRFEFTLPKTTRTRAKKYATEEDKQAAQKKRSTKRNALIKMLMQKYKDGDITDDDLGIGDDEDDE